MQIKHGSDHQPGRWKVTSNDPHRGTQYCIQWSVTSSFSWWVGMGWDGTSIFLGWATTHYFLSFKNIPLCAYVHGTESIYRKHKSFRGGHIFTILAGAITPQKHRPQSACIAYDTRVTVWHWFLAVESSWTITITIDTRSVSLLTAS